MVKSMKPGKQRKAHFNAPMHQKRKRVAARLQLAKPDARFAGVRTVTVRVGDVVQVTRGDQAHGGKRHGGKRNNEPLTGAVLRIDSEKDVKHVIIVFSLFGVKFHGVFLVHGAAAGRKKSGKEASHGCICFVYFL